MLEKKRDEHQECYNYVKVAGILESDCKFDHEMFGEKFYRTRVIVKRASGTSDYIPILVSEFIVGINRLKMGTKVEIKGQFRSYNQHNGERYKLLLFVFVDEISVVSDDEIFFERNEVYLEGYLCKKPFFRDTSFSKRQITDICLAVNRRYRKSDYIPCILWARNAVFASKCNVGDKLKIRGRIQSRSFYKIGETESREAYEVSVAKLEF